ncbi:RagB/SusD family nutrient uptake outer membrane protein [Pontibacter sp. 172403-2]|uniref:RagB/SusD family nutrient uptake outer membrane protein n=1 Tax=Pontibacter rufus TaxID=2791028 RepID=UPI0018AFE856|nr:RagB/SusD family nutrient uptake outer membrane protein [Pontibacter sp. 172403-2]MBF9252293.1 RagB/SusD family nutrient uptake outer membrane protein [Pontibacter sp. 172403-2]
MKKRFKYIIYGAMVATLPLFTSCDDEFLDKPAIGALSDDVLANEAGVEKLLIGAYAALDGIDIGNWEVDPTNWVYGSVAGGEAHKGSNGADQPAINPIATFNIDPSNGFINLKWRAMYEGISRTNSVLTVLAVAEGISESDKQRIAAEARFLRGHYYFELKKMFNMVPWIDETTTEFNQPNNVDIWPNIEADFKFAFDNLPNTQAEVGRANKWAAASYLGKTYLYQHKYAEAKSMFDQVITSGVTSNGLTYGLVDKFKDNWTASAENNKESIFAVQMVANDGTNTIANANQGLMLNFPYNSPFRCCGFYQPTLDLANSYQTTAQGLPLVNSYNADPLKTDQGVASDKPFTPDTQPVDPRLDWTVGRRGIPFLDWGLHPGQAWIREQSTAGPYSAKKFIYWQSTADTFSDQSSWAPGSAINVLIIRFADVLLMAAEAEAQLGNLALAQDYVNRVRARAARPENIVHTYVDPAEPLEGFTDNPAANYNVAPYPAGYFAGLGKDAALEAIYFERKLELALEGHRFFDLVRWGKAAEELNAFFDYEGAILPDVEGGRFKTGKNEYYPIPQRQIDLQTIDGKSVLTQNPGY